VVLYKGEMLEEYLANDFEASVIDVEEVVE
jgi:hypothetical protein